MLTGNISNCAQQYSGKDTLTGSTTFCQVKVVPLTAVTGKKTLNRWMPWVAIQ